MDKTIFRMMVGKDHPVIKIKLTSVDWAIELIGLASLIMLIVLPLYYLPQLPERIPIHFNGAGAVNGYGSRSTVWSLPVTGVFIYLLLTVLSGFPHIYNYPFKITLQNAQVQYRLASRFMRILRTLILINFLYLTRQTITNALGKTSGLGKAFLPVFMITIFGSIIFYLVLALNNRQNS
jgi:uncharacterized membrane protein